MKNEVLVPHLGSRQRVDERAVNRYGNANARAVLEYFWVLDYVPAVLGGGSLFRFFFYRRYRLWKLGTPKELQGSVKERLLGAVADVFTQRRVVREKGPGIMHLAIFWGMLFCILATTFVALQADFGLQILYGDFYLYFISLAVDLAGFVCIVGVVIALVRRLGKFNKKSRK